MNEFGKNIRRFRQEINISQKELAELLHVSASAVSKWESGKAHPDLPLLPLLAKIFKTSTDQLLQNNEKLSEEDFDKLYKRCKNAFSEEGWQKGIQTMEEIFTDYPCENTLKMVLASFPVQYRLSLETDEERLFAYQYSEKLYRQIIKTGNDEERRFSQNMLAGLYLQTKRLDEAEKILEEMDSPDIIHPDNMKSALYMMQEKYTEAEKLTQHKMYNGIHEIELALSSMLSIAVKKKDMAKATLFRDTQRKFLAIFDLEEFKQFTLIKNEMTYALFLDDEKKILDSLEKYVDIILSLKNDYKLEENDFFSQIELQSDGTLVFNTALFTEMTKDMKNNPEYAGLQNNPRFLSVLRKLEERR